MFEFGDRVICKNADGTRLLKGSLYTVYSMRNDLVCLIGIGTDYGLFAFKADRFSKATREECQMNPDTLVINEKAKPKAPAKPKANTFFVRRVGGGSPKVVHSKFEDAKNEADRLSLLCPNEEYQVLAVAYSVKKVPVYTTQAQEYSV